MYLLAGFSLMAVFWGTYKGLKKIIFSRNDIMTYDIMTYSAGQYGYHNNKHTLAQYNPFLEKKKKTCYCYSLKVICCTISCSQPGGILCDLCQYVGYHSFLDVYYYKVIFHVFVWPTLNPRSHSPGSGSHNIYLI